MKRLQIFVIAGLTCVGTALVALLFLRPTSPLPQHALYTPQLAPLSGLPQLEDEATPYFSKQQVVSATGKEEIRCFRRDKSVAHLFFDKDNKLTSVRVDREDGLTLYRAEYDGSGRRIKKSWRYGSDGKVETLAEGLADGSVKYSFFRGDMPLREETVFADGRVSTVEFTSAGKSASSSSSTEISEDRVFWDKDQKQARLRVKRRGQLILSWEYFDQKGVSLHTGKALDDGSLEFRYNEKGKLNVRQVWRLVGEDWERTYYQLSYSEKFADDGVTIEHKAWVRSNGTLLRHERYSKTGVLEMRREFDAEGRNAMQEDIKDGVSEVHHYQQPRSRGFVPDGMRQYPGGDDKIGYVYDLDGRPFQHSVSDPHPWSFFVSAN